MADTPVEPCSAERIVGVVPKQVIVDKLHRVMA